MHPMRRDTGKWLRRLRISSGKAKEHRTTKRDRGPDCSEAPTQSGRPARQRRFPGVLKWKGQGPVGRERGNRAGWRPVTDPDFWGSGLGAGRRFAGCCGPCRVVQCTERPCKYGRRIAEFVRSRPPMVRWNAACDSNPRMDASCGHRFADRRLLSCPGKGQKSCDRRVASRWPHGLFATMATWH